MRFVLVTITAIIIVILAGIFFKNTSKQLELNTPLTSNLEIPSPSSTPLPFYELTIPYLRNREYKATLSNLQKVSENQNYASFLVSYTSDGLKINGLLTQPMGDKPQGGWPAIIFIHGYIPPKNYQTLQSYLSYIDFLAKNNFVVFKIDLRGHANSEGESEGTYYSSDYVIDTLNAYSALQSSDFINPKMIGLWGHSMAGNIAFRSFVARKEIPAVVIWAGAVYSYEDFQEFSINDNSYRPPALSSETQKKRQKLFDTYGQFSKDHPFWKQVVPTNYLEGQRGAIQVHHAIDDVVVDIRYSRNLMSILDKTSIEHALYEYPSGGHNISGDSFSQAMQRTVEFFKERYN